MTFTPPPQKIPVPNLITGQLVNKDGYLTDNGVSFFNQLITSLQYIITPEGVRLPSLASTVLPQLTVPGAIIYANDNDKFYGNIAGVYKPFLNGDAVTSVNGVLPIMVSPNIGDVIVSLEIPLAFNYGGTGQTSYTDGQLLIGNSFTGGISKSTLAVGSSNLIVTNGNGTISIDRNPDFEVSSLGVGTSATGVSGNIKCSTFQMTTSPVIDYVMTSDASGNGTWSDNTRVISITGTNHQVYVNGTSGTPVSGIITLTLPQDIDLTSSPTFAGLLLNGATSGTISILPQAVAGTYNFNLPTSSGATGDVLLSGGGGSNPMRWVDPTTAFVTSLTGIPPIIVSAPTGNVTISVSNATTSTVGVASFDATNFSVSAGAVTSQNFTISAGTGLTGGGSLTLGGSTTISLSIPVIVADGGTGNTSFTSYAPICAGTSSTGALQQATSGFSTSGNIFVSTGSSSLPMWSALSSLAVTSITAIFPLNASSSVGNVTLSIAPATTLTLGAASFNFINFSVSSGAVNTIQDINTAATPTFAGLLLNGSSSGTISILPQAVAGTYNFNLPTSSGSIGYILTSGGGGSSPMTWTNPATGFVTSLTATAPITVSAATGNVNIALTTPLAEIYGGTGETTYTDGQLLIGSTASSGLVKSTLTQGFGVDIINGAGSITLKADLTAGTGISLSNGPGNSVTISSTNVGLEEINYVQNPQFLIWDHEPVAYSNTIVTTSARNSIYEQVCDGWYIYKNYAFAPSADSISRIAFTPGQTAVEGTPEYYLQYQCTGTGVTSVKRLVTFFHKSCQFLNGQQVTASIAAFADTSRAFVIKFGQYFGTGGSPSSSVETVIGSWTLNTSWTKYSASVTIPSISGKTIGSNRDDYCYLILELEPNTTSTYSFTNVLLQPGNISNPTFPAATYAEYKSRMEPWWQIPTGQINFACFDGLGLDQNNWLLMQDQTIGNPNSGATNNGLQYYNLFVYLYQVCSDSWCPVSGGRSGNAVNDWNANKTLTVPTSMSRLIGNTGSGTGLSTRDPGEFDGNETITITDAQIPAHNHGLTGGAAYANVPNLSQPYIVLNVSGGSNAYVVGINNPLPPVSAPTVTNLSATDMSVPSGGTLQDVDIMNPSTFLPLYIHL